MTEGVFFYVQHLLGIGHLRRAATIGRALAEAGLDVEVVSGGHPLPGLDLGPGRLVQLPPTRATDLYFKVLVDENDQPIDDAWKARRANALMEAWRASQPTLLLFELFPFGRRQMRFEILPLLEAAKASARPPVIVCSVRDILVAQNKPERNDEMLDLIERYFDHVLVHGDPALIPFDATFPPAHKIADKIRYTGYVVDRSGSRGGPDSPGHDEVIVSCGGGAVGLNLLRTAIAARPLTEAAGRRWRVLVGVTVPEDEFRALAASAGDGVIVERARPDFPTLLMNCALSISQGGYNTVMEVLHAGCRAVVVPYAGGLETEQTLRARLLGERGALTTLAETELDPGRLAATVDTALAGPPARSAVATNGLEETVRLIEGWTRSSG
ncbi:glycosyltransferase family protein [Oceanibacterium hippocampi]|uniref:Undecaprenyldiphospho-muramoylpentapeptide beta-N-acetylglucosaminyltransferase n=1 Tax=Oceanibacterium hippocampi TaxID=745714 RepID=A0A1Y5RMS5_9PROT|nr:glycosyltransferase [Oceanibacterium hippocampi]SLN20005.1 undecaprenyldiphospho-muramoylpentapeptide beta-N-acetylglucosaminyltransferase [Oceanibacterium hippocampi]